MKALVLAGGVGSRLRPLSYAVPKQLVPVGGRPVLFHCLEAIREAGITEVGMIVGAGSDRIHEAVGDGTSFGLRITYLEQQVPLGLAHCVRLARDFLGDDDFVLYLGDNVIQHGIRELVSKFNDQRPDALLAVSTVADPTSYGVAEIDTSGLVQGLQEKPHSPKSDLAIVGVYVFSAAVHHAVWSIAPSPRGELEITDAIQYLLERERPILAYRVPGYWKDTGKIDDLLDCQYLMLEALTPSIEGKLDTGSTVQGPVVLARGARVTGSRLVGPLIIGTDTYISNSYIGPFTSVGSGADIEDSTIDFSILMDGVIVRSVDGVRESVVGRATNISRHPRETVGHRLVVGDDSQVAIAR